MGKLDGKVAIITGSTSGMGRETAYLFAKEGAKVVVTGRNEARAQAAVEKIKAEGGEAICVIADTSDLSAPQKIFDATMAAYGTVDILMNNAGIDDKTIENQVGHYSAEFTRRQYMNHQSKQVERGMAKLSDYIAQIG